MKTPASGKQSAENPQNRNSRLDIYQYSFFFQHFRGRKITPQGRKDLDLIASQVSLKVKLVALEKYGDFFI